MLTRHIEIGHVESLLPVCCAEFNAIVSAYRYHADLTSATLYTTGVPCSRCATKIVQSGIKTVVFGTQRKDDNKQNEAGANEEKEDDKVTVPQEPEADVPENKAGTNEEDEAVLEEEAKKIFYWGKVATM